MATPNPIIPGAGAERSDALDAVRGVAIGAVVLYHFFSLAPLDFPSWRAGQILATIAGVGRSGVDLFFVLSGFLIGGILLDRRKASNYYGAFYGRRFLRIAPLYALALAVFWLLYLQMDWHAQHLDPYFRHATPIWPYLTMTQNIAWVAAGVGGPAMLGITWSLAVEEQFYLVLPAMIRWLPDRLVPRVCLMLVVAAPLLRIALLAAFPHNRLAPYLLLPCRMDALFLGVLAAWMTRQPDVLAQLRAQRRGLWMAAAGLFLIIALMAVRGVDQFSWTMQAIGYSLYAGAYFFALLLVVSAQRALPAWATMARRPLVWLGLGAYSIYLFHRGIEGVVEGALSGRTTLGMLVSMALSAAFAVAAWVSVERPLMAYARRRFRYNQSGMEAAEVPA